MAPSAITRMMAIGVSQANMLVCSAVAPVMKGELCASASTGIHNSAATPRLRYAAARRSRSKCIVALLVSRLADRMRRSGTAGRLRLPAGLELFALDLSRSTKAEAVHDVG